MKQPATRPSTATGCAPTRCTCAFDHERIILADAGAFDLDDDEARSLAGALNETFADVGVLPLSPTSRRW